MGIRSIASMRDTAGVRERSVIGVAVLLLVGTLAQGVTHVSHRSSEDAAAALSRISRLTSAAAEVELLARLLEHEPDVAAHRHELTALVDELAREEASLGAADFEAAGGGTGWARVSLALASLTTEARVTAADAGAPRSVHRLRARAVALADEVEQTRAQLDADIESERGWLRWLSWGSWGMLMLSIVGVSRWMLAAARRRIANDRAELAEAERAVLDAADGERVRLGQELHDGLCQQLGGLRLLALATRRGCHEEATQESLETLEDLAARSLDMARALSHGLYPGDVRSSNLPFALERLGTELAELGPFEFSFEGPRTPPRGVSDADAMQLYRIAQEALSNAVRHGNPRVVTISLEHDPLTLSVQDDGVGLSSGSDGTTTAGVGLSSMHARARAVNAQIKFFSTPHEGTRVVVTRSEEPIQSEDSLDEVPVNPLSTWMKP